MSVYNWTKDIGLLQKKQPNKSYRCHAFRIPLHNILLTYMKIEQPFLFSTIFFALCLIPCLSFGQIDTLQKPKVGLVLSGGAAHGLAHIGVIKYLEEMGIQADYVTGTSIGSIIGGLYAMGYDSDKMREVAAAQNWDLLLSNHIPLNEVAPLEKNNHGKFPFKLGFKDGEFTLPKGVINSQKLDLMLSKIYCPTHFVQDFDELSVPFRCVATDIERGEFVVLDNGYLGRAIRASMAIPFIFTPIEVNDVLMVDGGLIRNYPVQEVLDMGADIVIGIYVGSELEEKDDLNSMFKILSQSAILQGVKDSEEQKQLTDINIIPEVKDYDSFGFADYDLFIEEGYKAAAKEKNKLEEIFKNYDRSLQTKRYVFPTPEQLNISYIKFPNTNKPFKELAIFKFGDKYKQRLSIDRIERGISNIIGTNHFDKINYAFETKGDLLGININAEPREEITFSGSVNSFSTTNTSFIIHTQFLNILAQPSSLIFNARISEQYGFQVDYNQRIGGKRNFLIHFQAKTEVFETPLYSNGVLQKEYKENNADIHFFGGYEPNNYSYVEVGLSLHQKKLKPTDFLIEDIEEYRVIGPQMNLNMSYNTLDANHFAKNGISLLSKNSLVFAQDETIDFIGNASSAVLFLPSQLNYFKTDNSARYTFSFLDIITSNSRIGAGLKTSTSLLDNFRIGGLHQSKNHTFPFVGIEETQFQFDKYFAAQQEIMVNVFGPVYLSGIINYVSGDRAFQLVSNVQNEAVSFIGYGAGLYVRTPIGPLSFIIGKNTKDDQENSSLGLGFRYIY